METTEKGIVLNGYQAKQLVEFADMEDGYEMAVEYLPERTADNGERMEAGLYAWSVEYPEEGVLLLREHPQVGEIDV